MISHVVLFRTKADLSGDERTALIASFERAMREIPTVRSVRVGKRIAVGAGYEQRAVDGVEFLVAIDFDDVIDLQTYLEHPAHAELAERFNRTCVTTMILDVVVTQDASGVSRWLPSE
ncbi:MAG TPA: Dabb family protein [Vicinamibacterales bacterium]|nr:Dabb family protein [Vicinamibacterales bacterium]